jgi:hypothetical protein
MSKLSEGLKALINAPYALPHTVKAPPNIRSIYGQIASTASKHSVGVPAWLTISTAATMTLNSPQSLLNLHSLASTHPESKLTPTETAEMMREVGLKCISFNGIPRTINMLGAFRDGLPSDVQNSLSKQATRRIDTSNAESITDRGRSLWDSIYRPFEDKLIDKLALSHPNLPVVIVEAHYGAQLSDPPSNMPVPVGRVLTSLIAIACLRAQTGVAPQVLSHVFGLRKAFEDGSAEGEDEVQGGAWLASEDGNRWTLESIDQIVKAVGEERVGTFATGFIKAKL